MISSRSLLLFLSLSLFSFFAQSQSDSLIIVSGEIVNEAGLPITGAMILNLRTYNGQFARSGGKFDTEIRKTDSLSFGAFGMKSKIICLADSVEREKYELKIVLEKLRVEVGTAEVFAPRELKEIYDDIDELGFNEKDYRESGVDALSSPITFLYQQFSRREQNKRLAIQLANNDRRRELLKELFQKYVDFDIIELQNEDFDEFISFLNVNDEFLQSTSQYQFLLYVKDRFRTFKKMKRTLDSDDFDYHLDD